MASRRSPSSNARPGTGDRRPRGAPRPGASVWYVLGFVLLVTIAQAYLFAPAGRSIPYSEFKQKLREGAVAEVTVATQTIRGKFKPDKDNRSEAFSTARIEVDSIQELEKQNVKFPGGV